MKKFVSAVLIIMTLASCSKNDLVTPAQQEEPVVTGNVFYKDANVAIANVKATPSGDNVKFSFTSLYEKNVAKVEVMSGPYENMLCFFYAETLASVSNSTKKYVVTENGAAAGIRFYVIKYTMKSGAWIMTPAFRFEK
jgi:hypothetical protein